MDDRANSYISKSHFLDNLNKSFETVFEFLIFISKFKKYVSMF